MEQIIEKWEEILQTVKTEHDISDISFNAWLKPLSVFSVEGNKLYILVPDEQIGLSYITKKYLLPIRVAVAEITGTDYEIEFILPEQTKKLKPYKAKNIESMDNGASSSGLNPNYTFNTFVVGNNNKFAYSASLAVAESPGEIYNPLFLYGGVGLGKTHLMHSIAHFIQTNNPEMKVMYVSSEIFTNELIDAIRNGNNSSMNRFREKYRNIDVLLIDDIQFIIGKESTQEEFFHTFNELHLAKKAIIISSDRPPKDMETLEERIRSRFEWGLISDIGSPDYETRMAILRRKNEMDYFELDDEILDYIATNIKSNIRELEGALNKLLAYSNLEHKKITMDIAVEELQNIISPDKPKEITPQLIIDVVCEHFNISSEQIVSKSRSNDIAKPRQVAMYLCKNMTDASLDNIGSLLGGRDHSTIIHGINKIQDEYDSSESLRNQIETIKKKINPN
ncbi:MAG: chromosomal replication initiator protein DnaA [Lachnospiraceae bacterium]|nr:chromosomal replication initiator protein DnaA [Lachnospiraceae bacterium]MDD7378088.1 chromosomal replication initiator protein DnaA [Lachnospiraceae bacterium]MDY4617070.1 chromosomal replication initiator protein DnaA [Lachnospiraceae bacterium]